jgi:hypothetical protein
MSCRRAFHAAARRWTVDAIGAGVLTIDEIKSGTPSTCMLLERASETAPIPAR